MEDHQDLSSDKIFPYSKLSENKSLNNKHSLEEQSSEKKKVNDSQLSQHISFIDHNIEEQQFTEQPVQDNEREESSETPEVEQENAELINFKQEGDSEQLQEYFEQLWLGENLNFNDKKLSSILNKKVVTQLIHLIDDQLITIKQQPDNIDELIMKLEEEQYLKTKPQSQIELEIKKKKLQDAQKLRQELAQKLEFIEENLSQLHQQKDEKKKKIQIEETEEQKKDRLELLKKIQLERKEQEKKKQELLRQEQEKFSREISERQERENQLKSEQERQKKEKILSNLESIKQRQELRSEQLQREKEKIKEIKSKKYFFQEAELKQKELIDETLEERKKRLAEIRDLHKPVDLELIQEHQKKYLETKDAKRNQPQLSEERQFVYRKPQVSEFYKKVEEQSKHQKILEEQKQIEKLQLLEKKQEYSSQIPKPQIDQKKKKELEELMHKLQSKPEPHKFIRKNKNLNDSQGENHSVESQEHEKNPYQIGLQYLNDIKAETKEHQKKKKIDFSADQIRDIPNQERIFKSNEQFRKNDAIKKESKHQSVNRLSVKAQDQNEKLSERKDYLKEMRQKAKPPRDYNKELDTILKNDKLSEQEKYQFIIAHANKLEDQAKRKEVLMRYNADQVNQNQILEQNKENQLNSDDYLVQAIKAKLVILDKNQ